MRRVLNEPNHTLTEIRGYIDALRIVVDEMGIDGDEYVVLAPTILELIAGKQVAYEQSAPTTLLLDGLRGPGH